MKTLQEKLIKHFKLPNANFLHKNLCGWLGMDRYNDNHDHTITMYQDGSIRVGKKCYAAEYSLQEFLAEMEKKHNTVYKELKDIASEMAALKNRLMVASGRFEGNGWGIFYPEMIKKLLEGYSGTVNGVYEGVNAIANNTPSYGVGVDD